MKFVVFGARKRVGVLVGDRVLDLAGAHGAASPIFNSLVDLIEAGDRGLDRVQNLMERHGASDDPALLVQLSQATLHAPFPGRKFALAGSNNADHVSRGWTNMGRPMTPDAVRAKTRAGPAGGFWSVAAPAGSAADIPYPQTARGLFDFEGEVAVILGKGGKGLKAEQWMERIWGTTLVIDWSVRNDDLFSNKRPFYAHKVFDNAKSIGPWIAVDEVDPANCQVETRVNGHLRQAFNSGDMIHSYGELFEQMSQDLTLLPGDVLSGGTGPGTAADSTIPGPDGKLPLDQFLKEGDLVEVTAPELGCLAGRVVPYDGPKTLP